MKTFATSAILSERMALGSDVDWNIDMEVNLFHAMRGHKPAGVNRHFQMISIHDKLSSSTKKVTSCDVWKHLSTLYDLQALNESEIVPFPNKNGDFSLGDKEMVDMFSKSFPRSSYITAGTSDSNKTEASGKNISKLSSKQDSGKPGSLSQTPKLESKIEQKVTSASKADSRSSTPNRSESKSSSNSSSNSTSKSSHQNTPTSIPSPSPKRTKRTRNINSASASPATPTEPQAKRRR